MRADYHVHTEFSDDSDYAMEKVIQDSIAMGLDEICFTDHVDYGIKKDWDEPGKMIYLYCNRSGLFYLDVVKGIDDRRNGYDDTEERRQLESAAKILFG